MTNSTNNTADSITGGATGSATDTVNATNGTAVAADRPDPRQAPVTLIGLGPMGLALAEALLAAGHPTTVWNRSAHKADGIVAKGAHRAATPAEAVAASPLVIVCLKDYDTLYEALDPAAAELSGRAVVNLNSGTPHQAHAAVGWAAERGAHYLDGAIMVPPYAVAQPGSVFLYSGDRAVFDTHRQTLAALGDPRYLGADPSLAVLHNAALLELMYATMNGFLHATALVGSAGVKATEFAEIVDWFLPAVVTGSLGSNAPHLDTAHYPGDLGTMEMNLTALEHIADTSAEQGVNTELPHHLRQFARRAVTEGFGANNYLALFELLKKPAPTR